MFISFYAFYIWLYVVLMLSTGFDEINLDVHLECMSIVTDATQNQNGVDLTLSWGVENYNFGNIPLTGRTAEIIVDSTFTGESKLSSTSTIKLESHKSRKLIAASNYKMHNFAIASYNSFGQERTNEIWNFPQWNKVRTHYGIRLELWLLQGHNEIKPDWNKVRTHCGIRLWNAWILWCIFILET